MKKIVSILLVAIAAMCFSLSSTVFAGISPKALDESPSVYFADDIDHDDKIDDDKEDKVKKEDDQDDDDDDDKEKPE